jgi:hypothetical protein
MRKEDDVHHLAGRLMFGALTRGGPAYHELMTLWHLAHPTYETAKEILTPEEPARRR